MMQRAESSDASEIVRFLRRRDYKLVRELGQGSCGKTVLLHDDQLDEYFVCKKYLPQSETLKMALFENFVNEIRLLHQLQHHNIVRIFNHYLYPEQHSGYILMEYIDGQDLQEHVKTHPESLNDLFLQAITGFSYLERSNVLHRDIRPGNLLVDQSGVLKIIDLGFGKHVINSDSFENSTDLNLWCPTPSEFTLGRYDFSTEVYFVGKLFEELVDPFASEDFDHADELQQMCYRNSQNRTASFAEIERRVLSRQFRETDFTQDQIEAYRRFSDAVSKQVTKIENAAKYVDDLDQVYAQVKRAFRTFMLEEFVPDSAVVFRCFITGGYFYVKQNLSVGIVKNFLALISTCGAAKRQIIFANLYQKLDSIKRYSQYDIVDDDLPF